MSLIESHVLLGIGSFVITIRCVYRWHQVGFRGFERAVMILTAGAEGGHAASEWGCREIIVSIVVANLPIIQPLMRKLANKLGLDMLSSSSGTRPAQSNLVNQGTEKAAGTKNYPVAHPARPPKEPGVLADRGRFSTLPSCSASQRGSNRPVGRARSGF